jgi:hypothetical protein
MILKLHAGEAVDFEESTIPITKVASSFQRGHPTPNVTKVNDVVSALLLPKMFPYRVAKAERPPEKILFLAPIADDMGAGISLGEG